MGLFQTDFNKCPMHLKSADSYTRLRELNDAVVKNTTKMTDLEIDVNNIAEDMRKLGVEHSITMQSHVAMKEDVNEMKVNLESYMEDGAEQNILTNQAIGSLVDSVSGLVNDQNKYREKRVKEEGEKEELHKKWRDMWFKVGGSILTVIMLGIGTFVWKSMDYYAKAQLSQDRNARALGYTVEGTDDEK